GDVCSLKNLLQDSLVLLVACCCLTDLGLLQHLRVHPQRTLGSLQFGPVGVPLAEVVFDPRSRLGAVAHRQHHRGRRMTTFLPCLERLTPVRPKQGVCLLYDLWECLMRLCPSTVQVISNFRLTIEVV